jgi:hypothetical protein
MVDGVCHFHRGEMITDRIEVDSSGVKEKEKMSEDENEGMVSLPQRSTSLNIFIRQNSYIHISTSP